MLTAAASIKLKNNCKHDHKLTVTKYSMEERNSYLHCLNNQRSTRNIYIHFEGSFQIKNDSVYIL